MGGTASRHRQSCENSLDDGLTRHGLSLGFIADNDAVTQYIGADALYVLRRDVAAAVQERVGARTECEINGGARRSSVANQSFQPQIVGAGLSRGPDHVNNVIFHAVVDVDVVNDVPRGDDLLRINDRIHSQIRCRSRHQIEDASLLALLWVADVQLEHETIKLRLRQLVGAFLFDWILSGQNQERIGERISLFADGDLPFLHRFQQRALNFGGRAIDFVGQNQIRKDWSKLGGEFAGTRIIDERSD